MSLRSSFFCFRNFTFLRCKDHGLIRNIYNTKYSFCKCKMVGRKKVERRKIEGREIQGTSKIRPRKLEGIWKQFKGLLKSSMVVKLESGLISDNLWSIYSFCRCKIVARYMQGICKVYVG